MLLSGEPINGTHTACGFWNDTTRDVDIRHYNGGISATSIWSKTGMNSSYDLQTDDIMVVRIRGKSYDAIPVHNH